MSFGKMAKSIDGLRSLNLEEYVDLVAGDINELLGTNLMVTTDNPPVLSKKLLLTDFAMPLGPTPLW